MRIELSSLVSLLIWPWPGVEKWQEAAGEYRYLIGRERSSRGSLRMRRNRGMLPTAHVPAPPSYLLPRLDLLFYGQQPDHGPFHPLLIGRYVLHGVSAH